MDIFLQLISNGLLLGGSFAIISIGLTLIFGIVRVVNFAHGEFLMIGMYGAYFMSNALGAHPYWTALPLMLALFVVGAVVQRFVIQPLLDSEPAIQIFATVGIQIALTNLALLAFGADTLSLQTPSVREQFSIGPVQIVSGHAVSLAAAVVLVVGLELFFRKTFLGRAIRATAQHRYAAQLMGVNVNHIYIVSFGIGLACLGLAAALVTPMYTVFPTVGGLFSLVAFVVVVLGGMGSMQGAFLGAMIIGLVDSLAGYYVAPDLKEVVYFGIFIGILLLKPTGLLGLGRGSE